MKIAFHNDDGHENVFQSDSLDPNKFTFQNFFNFYHQLVGRTEIDLIFAEMYVQFYFHLTLSEFLMCGKGLASKWA